MGARGWGGGVRRHGVPGIAGVDTRRLTRLIASEAVASSADFERVLALSILSYILVGTSAAPLRKALIDSGLGEDLTGGGFLPDPNRLVFRAIDFDPW